MSGEGLVHKFIATCFGTLVTINAGLNFYLISQSKKRSNLLLAGQLLY